MTFGQFDKYQEDLLAQVVEMKSTKGREYANSESRFANFDRLSARLGMSNLQIALVYFTKHMDAIESYVKKGRTYSTETIQGRIVDAITYLTLIGGMIQEFEESVPVERRIVAHNLDKQVCNRCSGILAAGESIYGDANGNYTHVKCPSTELSKAAQV
jgi:hypothetical protein